MTSPDIDLAAKRLVVEELRIGQAQQFAAADSLDEKLRELLSSSSLILTVVATLQIAADPITKGLVYFSGLTLALVLYVCLLIVILRGMRPANFVLTVPDNWEDIGQAFFCEPEGRALELLISSHLTYGPRNDAVLTAKSHAVRRASILLVAIVVVLIAIGVIGLLA